MNWPWLFFSFRGRINRARYWLAMLIYVLFAVCLWSIAWALTWFDIVRAGFGHPEVFRGMRVAFDFAYWFAGLAISAKRLHDRDKSAWWLLLLYLAPFGAILPGYVGLLNADLGGMAVRLAFLAVGAFFVWFFVELGCLPGTRGYNRYGRDPLGKAYIAAGNVHGSGRVTTLTSRGLGL